MRRGAHHREAANLQAKAMRLRLAHEASVFAAVTLWVLLHVALGNAKQADLYAAGLGHEAAILPTRTHDSGRRGCRGRLRAGRAAGTIVGVLVSLVCVVALYRAVVVARVAIEVTLNATVLGITY